MNIEDMSVRRLYKEIEKIENGTSTAENPEWAKENCEKMIKQIKEIIPDDDSYSFNGAKMFETQKMYGFVEDFTAIRLKWNIHIVDDENGQTLAVVNGKPVGKFISFVEEYRNGVDRYLDASTSRDGFLGTVVMARGITPDTLTYAEEKELKGVEVLFYNERRDDVYSL